VLGKSGSYKDTYGSSLTDMTLGEIYHKQNTKQRGLSMDEHISSGGLHAVGRYQFIGSTLQDEARRMGLSPDTKFTPQVQDDIFLSHIKRVGNISPWVGPSNNYSSNQKQQFNTMIAGF
jgi:muramidase (phage lysozyme)